MRFALLRLCRGKVRIFFIITVTFEEHWLAGITIPVVYACPKATLGTELCFGQR